MPDVRYVDVAPLPAGHESGPACWCDPVRSLSVGDAWLLVHRTDPEAGRPLEPRGRDDG